MLNKYVSADSIQQMLRSINLKFLDGRSPAAPELPPESLSAILRREEGRAEKEKSLAQGD